MSKFNDIIQNYNELRLRVNLFNQFFTPRSHDTPQLILGHIQKIYSTHQYVAFSLRFPGRNCILFIGRGTGHEGLHWRNSLPPSALRVRDRYLEYLRKFMVGAYLNPIILAKGDRVLHFPYSRAGVMNYFSLFYKGRQLYFAHAENVGNDRFKLFASWAKLEQKEIELPENHITGVLENLFSQVGAHYELEEQADVGQEDETSHDQVTQYFESLKHSSLLLDNKRKKFLKRKIKNIESDLERVKNWSELKRTIEAPYFVFGEEYRQTICGIKFTFPSELNHFKRMGIVYDKIKGLKRGEQILTQRITESRQELLRGQTQMAEESYHLPERISSPVWGSSEEVSSSAVTNKDGAGVVEYSWRGIRWAVGTSSQGNDYLRSRWANKEDLWFHLDGETSPHLIIKRSDLQDIREDFLGIIASIIRDSARLEIDPIPLIYTQVKNLKGIKGKAGAVIHKKTKHLTLGYNPRWKEIISAA